MYDSLFRWLRTTQPDLKTLYGGVEEDFAHSRATWYTAMKADRAQGNGYAVLGETKWLLNDTSFAVQVREIKKAARTSWRHPFTRCGLMKELARQRVKPKLIVGLETIQGCASLIEGMTITSSFAPFNKEPKCAAEATARKNGAADLHSMAAWENIFILKSLMEVSPDEATLLRSSPTAGRSAMGSRP